MLISVHLPKTAGKSFEAALQARFGSALREDYGTFPMNTPRPERHRAALEACLTNASASFDGVSCIHGHFLPLKYLLLADQRPVTFVTWLRHPVQRAISNYHYWRRAYDPSVARPLHRRVVEEDWTLERFCLCDEMRDMYTQFLWGFPLENFDFIGITEHFDADLAEFAARHLGIAVTAERLNAATGAGESYTIETGLHRRIAAFHGRDMALYARALALRQARLATSA
jgi:hypothetical protein